jgi:malonate transporter and related proteins
MTRSLGPERFVDFAGVWQTAWRFNSALAFVVMASLPPESAALMSVAIGVGVPMANLLAVGALSRGNGLGLGAMLKQVAVNPFLLASMAGISVAIAGLHLPVIPMKSIASLSSIAVPLALISLGASMNWKALYRLGRLELAINTIKLIALPLAALILGEMLDLPKSYTVVLIAFAALPTGTVGHIMAAAFGADSAPVSNMIAQSTLFGLLTLPCWMFAAHLL